MIYLCILATTSNYFKYLRFPLCASIYPWKTAETLMRRARKTTLPSIPNDLNELRLLFDNGQLERYSSNHEVLYKGNNLN